MKINYVPVYIRNEIQKMQLYLPSVKFAVKYTSPYCKGCNLIANNTPTVIIKQWFYMGPTCWHNLHQPYTVLRILYFFIEMRAACELRWRWRYWQAFSRRLVCFSTSMNMAQFFHFALNYYS
jgi:hypothetical protein